MRFTKMEGLGNDYVYVDCLAGPIDDPPGVARIVSDRHFGIGSDGLILIEPSEVADVRMRMFNADGSEAEMCGNGVRCVAKYALDHGLVEGDGVRVETGAGVLSIAVEKGPDGLVRRATVEMGRPRFGGAGPVVDEALEVAGRIVLLTAVSMGNPHAVVFVEDVANHPVAEIGAAIEVAPRFPGRTNVEFVEVLGRGEVRQRTWERGSGETLACGTGACATVVAGVLGGRTDRRVVVHLAGGDLEIEWGADDVVRKTGPAREVFTGVWPASRASGGA